MLGYQQQQQGGDEQAPEPTPVPGTIHITNLSAEATVEKLEELFGSLGKIKVNYLLLYHHRVCVCVCVRACVCVRDHVSYRLTRKQTY